MAIGEAAQEKDTSAVGEQSPYAALRARAQVFLAAQGGAAAEEDLARYLFGSHGPIALWRPLLRQTLTPATDETAEGFARRDDGWWQLPGAPAPTVATPLLAATPYVVLDVETTGLQPTSHRIIEVAALRFRPGQEPECYSTLVHPERPLTRFIIGLTKITPDLLEDAPRFDAIAESLRDFLGDDLLVGHNIGFDLTFLNAELRRGDLPPLLNPILDTIPLAAHLLPGQPAGRRGSHPTGTGLDAVARRLGLAAPGGQRHRAEADARLTAAVLAALLAQAPARGLHTLDDLLRVAGAAGQWNSREGSYSEAVARGRALLDPENLRAMPHAPGCYLMRDRHGDVLYVGKAKDLRNRVSSYYSTGQHVHGKHGLLAATEQIEKIVVGSELEALLLESQLIRRHTPRYNVQGRNFEHYPYIKVDTADAWPRVYPTRRRTDDGARYFGPFRDGRAVRRVLDLLTDILPIRTCTRRARTPDRQWSPCLRLSLGKCLGPCAGQTTQEEYGALVADLIQFLEGDERAIVARLWAQMEQAAERLDFERAQALRNALTHITTVAREGKLIADAIATDDLILVLPAVAPDAVEAFLLTRGRLWSRTSVARDEAPAAVADRLRRAWQRAHAADLPPLDHETIDETAILSHWLHRHHETDITLPLPASDDDTAWLALAAGVLAATPAPTVWNDDPEPLPAIAEASDEG
ncbi:MAG: exonuclease domain-containing protein [Thermomicrobiales bacterium]